MIRDLRDYKKEKKKLIKHNHLYYDKSSPQIDDATYDKLKKKLLDFENKNKSLISGKKVSDIVGFKPSEKFSKVKHHENMLSLDNAFDQNDIIDFYKKINNYLNFDPNHREELFA